MPSFPSDPGRNSGTRPPARIARSITRPVDELYSRVREIGDGDMTVRPPVDAEDGKLRALGEGLEEMVSRLSEQRELNRQEQLRLRSMELALIQAQINPHFLYNTLGSVKSLCITDPERAAGLVQEFSEYLQTKFVSIDGLRMVPVEKELEVVEQYLRIECVRFPNMRVEYDIMAEDFEVPALSIQTLVENAVHHGIGQRRHNAGTLKI